MNVQWPLLCTSLRSNCIDIFMFILSFEPLGWGIVYIQIWAVSSDWFLTIALWEFSLSSRYRASLKGLFYSHISKNKPDFHFSLSKVNFDEVAFTIFFPPVHCAFWVRRNCNLTQGHKYLWFLWEMLLLNAHIKVYGLFWVNFHGCWGSG